MIGGVNRFALALVVAFLASCAAVGVQQRQTNGSSDLGKPLDAGVVAKRLGDDACTARHFAAAERGLERSISAGEVYTLGPLAKLYVDAGTHLDRARALAAENLEWKRDREAVATLAAVQVRLASMSDR